MQDWPQVDEMERAIRAKVCTRCSQRPTGSETLGPGRPRACQGQCTIFINLSDIRQHAMRAYAGMPEPFESAVRDIAATHWELAGALDGRGERLASICPLSRHLRDVIDALDELPRPMAIPPAELPARAHV